MYLRFFNLREHPFNLTPDPRFLFLSPQHEETLSHLLYGIQERKGFIEVTGEVGTGKTLLCRALLDRLDQTVSTALIFNSYLTELELLQAIVSDFGLTCQETTRKGYIDVLNAYLLEEFAAGRNAMVLIDEAQNLEPRVLEQLRMLSNLETERGKLLQVVLVGQPELRDRLATPQMRQLDQRIAIRCHMHGLSRMETQQYITHRLSVAGAANAVTFTRRALSLIYWHCAGIPRRINLLCDRILTAAYVRGTPRITARLVRHCLHDLGGTWQAASPQHVSWWRPVVLRAAVVSLAGIGALSLLAGSFWLPTIQARIWPLIAPHLLTLARFSSLASPVSSPAPVPSGPPVQVTPAPPAPSVQMSAVSPAPPAQVAPTPPAPQLAGSEAILARTLWSLKGRAQGRLESLQTAPLGSRELLSVSPDRGAGQAPGNGKNFEIMPIQIGFPQLARVSRPCFIEVTPDPAVGQPVLWVLAKGAEDHVVIYQEPGGLKRVPVQQLQHIWYGKLYLTLEVGTYRGQVLRPGMSGTRIQAVQHLLKDLGYFGGAPSGQFDLQTQHAVMSFQRDNQLMVDGHIGWQTVMMLLHLGGRTLEETT